MKLRVGASPVCTRGTWRSNALEGAVPCPVEVGRGSAATRCAGYVTSAAEKGAAADRIMDHTGHRSVAMVRVYVRRAESFADHAGAGLL